MKSESGSIAILVAGYLALQLTLILWGSSLALGLVLQNRIQGIADSALLYGHDQARRKDVPSQQKLQSAANYFLATAESAKQISVVSATASVTGKDSQLVLCARFIDVIENYRPGTICKTAKARSYLVD